jgi:serine/alanine adding enzyme
LSDTLAGLKVHDDGRPLPDGLSSPDVYFERGYGRAASITDGGQWRLFEAFDGAWQVPLICRTLPDGSRDAISPYGYSGVYASPSLSPAQVQEAWSATVSRLRELGVISVLLRHSPLVPQASDLPGLRTIVTDHPTIVLESADSDSAWSAMDHGCRGSTRKAMKNGYTGEVREAEARDLAPEGDFRRLYEGTMQRLDAASPYFFNDDYYRELLDGLGPNLYVAQIRDQAGVVACCGLLMRHGQRLHGHLMGSNGPDARMGANNLYIWTTTQFAIDQGLRQYHLGGGLSSRDGLFKFKRSFGGRELQYGVSGLIIDDDRYQSQVRGRAAESDTTVATLLGSGYFPAYRGEPSRE